jgi:hypothetical protein
MSHEKKESREIEDYEAMFTSAIMSSKTNKNKRSQAK